MDFRIGFKVNHKKYNDEWALDLQNITNYQSIFTEEFVPRDVNDPESVDKITVTGAKTKASVIIDGTLCGGCIPRFCFEVCPQRAISENIINNNQYVYIIDPQKCNSCGVCIRSCPYNAIIWKR